jgi:hypothetical protein
MTFTYSTREESERFAAIVALAVCKKMAADGLITKADADKFVESWTPVLIPRNSVLEWLRKAVFQEDGANISLVRFAPLGE